MGRSDKAYIFWVMVSVIIGETIEGYMASLRP